MDDWKKDPFYQGRFDKPRRFSKMELLAENGFKIIGGLIGLVVVLLILGGIGWFFLGGAKVHTKTLTVNDKASITDCSNNSCDHKYLIYTDEGTFQNTDSLIHHKFNSSDLYGKLKIGKTYVCKYYGWRIHITSSYPNLISCKEA